MARPLDAILASHDMTKDELDALFDRFDTDNSGKLEAGELEELAKTLALNLPNTNARELFQIMDFYEIDRDGAFDRDELAAFIKIQLDG